MKPSLLLFLAVLMLTLSCQKSKEVSSDIDPDSLHNRQVGSSANDLLQAAKYNSLVLEIQYMPGFAPDAGAISHLQNFLAAYINKPGGISVTTREVLSAGKQTLTANEVHAFEKANRSTFTANGQLSVYVLYTDGGYSENNVLGIAYRNTSIALFGKKIRDNSGGVGQVSRIKLEATVLEHELAHLLGLVDLGTPMQTQHKANGNHCSNQACLQHHTAETTDVLGLLLTGTVPALDGACAADLKANGGK